MVRGEYLEKNNPREAKDEKKEEPKQDEQSKTKKLEEMSKDELMQVIAYQQQHPTMRPICVSQEEMFNVMNDKLDNLIALFSQLRIVPEEKK